MAQPGGNRARASPQSTAETAAPRHEGGARATPKERAAVMDLRSYLRDDAAGRPVDRRDLDDGLRPDRALRDRGGVAARALIHDDRQAQDILIALNVHGLALGRHVLIDPSLSEPDRQGVLRHELRHVAQSGGGEPDLDGTIDVGDKADLHERDAAEAAAGTTATPIAPGGVNVVRYQKPDSVIDRQNEAVMHPIVKRYLKQQAIHKKWVVSREDRWYGEIGKQAKTLDEEIERTRQTVFAMRAHVLTSLTESNLVPENLSEQVASAEVAVELLQLSLKSKDVIADDSLPEEAVTAIRGPLNAFYFAAADFADEKYLQEWWRWSEDQQMADAFEKKRPEDQCKRNMCHSSRDNDKWMMTQGLRYQEPQSSEPYISRLQPPVDKAAKVADWEGVIKDYRTGARILDGLLLSSFRMSSDEDRQVYDTFQYAMEQGVRLEALRARSPKAQRIRAVYYPKDNLVIDPEDPNKQLEIANGIHWQFYLTLEGNEWVLQDFTAPTPRGPFRHSATQEDIDAVENPDPDKPRDPPTALFDQMNNSKIFPYGHLYYEMPSGKTWVLEMTEPWGWDEWLSAIGLTFAALALIVGTAGLAAPGVIAGAGTIVAGLSITAAGFSIAGTLMSLKESSDLGVLTEKELNRAILSIAGDIASALTAGLGTVVRAAGQAGRIANFAAQSTRLWFILRTTHKVAQVGSLATNVAQAMTATYDFINAFKAIQSQPGLSDEQRDEALQRLIMTGLMTGALMTLAIRGDVKDTMKLTVHTGADGKLVGIPDVEMPHGKPDVPGAPHAKPGAPDVDAAARAAGGDLGFAPPPVKPGKVPVVENPDLKQEAGIKLHRGQDGAVDGMSVEYRPGARQEMIDLHLDVVNKFTGIRGRITALLERLRAMFKGTNVPPLHLQMELYKHRLAASRIAEGFKTGKFLSKAEANAAVAELDSINRQIDDLELTIKDAASPARYDPSMVGIQQKPVGRPDLPDPPPGHTYYVRPDGVVDIRRLPGSTAPALRLEYGADGKPTGRFSNMTALEASGVLGAKLTPRTKKILAGLGYTVDSQGRISRPPGHADLGDMQPLTTEGDRIKIQTGTESLADQQKRLRTGMDDKFGATPGQKFDTLKAAEEAAGNKVALLEGIHDTKVTWSEILDATARKNMRTELRKAGMSNAEIDRLINNLTQQKGTVKVVLGTRGVRENYNYRSGQTPAGTSAGPGVERHHGHPLYLGGSHEKNVLFDLDPKAHDAVHDFFEKSLKLPSKGNPPGTSLNPGTIRNAVAGSARPGAAIIDPKTGAVTLKYLDE